MRLLCRGNYYARGGGGLVTIVCLCPRGLLFQPQCFWWQCSTWEVGHKDPWVRILWPRKMDGGHVQVRWAPSHLDVCGNEEADALAPLGRGVHPECFRPTIQGTVCDNRGALGLEPMQDRELNFRRKVNSVIAPFSLATVVPPSLLSLHSCSSLCHEPLQKFDGGVATC